MNKLISRNPVLRFKLGRKILKALLGTVISNLLLPLTYKGAKKTANFIGQAIDGVKKGSIPENNIVVGGSNKGYGIGKSKPEDNVEIKDDGEKSRKIIKKVSTPSSVFAGHRIGRTGGLKYNINDTDKLQLIGTGQFTESDFTNAMAAQLALNRYFANSGLGKVHEDGYWGDLSRAALDLALLKSKSTTPFNNETTVVKTLMTPTYTPPTTPINLEVTNLKLNVPTYYNANRSETRDWMRSNGINPYSVTGATRAAVRRLRAGQADDNDRLLVKGNEQLYNLLKGYYKQGGQLPSRNVVERFKQGKKILFAKRGTYFSVTVGKNTYLYNPYNGTYKGTLSSGENISYKDIANAFNKQYESVKTGGNSVYRKRGSRTTWTNQDGKLVNLAPKKAQQTNNSSFKTSANGRFRVVDLTSGKELRFDSRDEAKKYQMSATKLGTRVLYDDKKEGYGVLKVDRTKEKSTEWARNLRETNNNKSFKDAYNNARSKGDRWFAYQGKVYNSDLKDYKNDNLTEMKAIYGNDLGWGKDPKYNTKSSAQARNAQNKEIKALNSNRNANYKGKTNKLASTEADKKVAQTYNEEDLVDAFLPATAFGNGMNYLASTVMGEDYHPEVFHSGLNPAVGMANLMRGEWNKVGERALNAASVFGGPWIGKGVKWLGTKMAPEITNLGSKSAYLSLKATIPAANGTGRTLNKMAERAVSGNFTSPTTTYGRYSLQNAANNGVLDQFAVNGGFNNAARWGDRLVRNNNTGTGYIFRSGTTHPYDAAVDSGTKVIPWATSLGTPVVSTTLHNLTED